MPDEITLDGETWLPFDIDDVGVKDAITVEEHLNTTWLNFLRALGDKDSVSARHLQAIAWLARHPAEPDLQIVDVEAAVAKIAMRSSRGEDNADPLPSGSADSDAATESSSTSFTASSPGTGID